MMFDGAHPWVIWISHLLPRTYRGFAMRWGVRAGRDVERLDPRLRPVEQVRITAQYDLVPVRHFRMLYRLLDRIPGARESLQLFRFEF
jgi:hypothetical protein